MSNWVWRVQVPTAAKTPKYEEVTADSVKFYDGGTLAFYYKDSNIYVLSVAYAAGQWLTVDTLDEEPS